jgi:hypothetical protein
MGIPNEDMAKILGLAILAKIDELGMQFTWKTS